MYVLKSDNVQNIIHFKPKSRLNHNVNDIQILP